MKGAELALPLYEKYDILASKYLFYQKQNA